MSTEITKYDDVQQKDESVRIEFTKLIDYYSQFFTDKQLDALVYFWYRLDLQTISELTEIREDVLSEWLMDVKFKQAIQAGLGRRKEILSEGLEKAAAKALKVVTDLLDADVQPREKGFVEKIRTARWVLDKMNVDVAGNKEESDGPAVMTESTAKLVADELRKMLSGGPEQVPVEVSKLFKDDIVDGEIVDLSSYYSIVDSEDAFVEEGIINVHRDTLKLQCHLCYKWFNSLILHLAHEKSHPNITLIFYRAHFGIPDYIPLASDERFFEILSKKIK